MKSLLPGRVRVIIQSNSESATIINYGEPKSNSGAKLGKWSAGMLLPGLLLLGLVSWPGAVAHAADDGLVDVGGEHVLTIYYPSGGYTVKQRADKVTERLVTILGDPHLRPDDIQALPNGKSEAKIMVKNQLLYTVDMPTARRNSTTPIKLAQSYVTHLRSLLPRINVKPNPNLGEPANGDK